MRVFFFILILFSPLYALAQTNAWTNLRNAPDTDQQLIQAEEYFTFSLQEDLLRGDLSAAREDVSAAIKLPNTDGSISTFDVVYDPVMHPVLAQKFPSIRSYKVINPDDNGEWGRIDISHKGFRGMIYSRKGTYFIDPYATDVPNTYMVYFKRDFITDKSSTHSCGVTTEVNNGEEPHDHDHEVVALNTYDGQRNATIELRTYRLAIAATGEYTAFHGGSATDAMSAIVTTLNRVNGIYEKELSIRMELIANNDLLIYTSSAGDPYTNGATGTMINENQQNITNVIGSTNYDIGHVFGTNSGGLASLGSVCSGSSKARGVTGSGAPINDPFDVDYVAHEFGHQFGANHTFNNCGGNENSSTAMEPGSGSTIMAYAGLCGSNNLQGNSNDYFHVVSLEEIIAFSTNGGGYTCAEKTISGNNSPQATVINSGFSIPKSTYFELEATATDPDGDDLEFCWEQYNIGPESPLGSPTGNAPAFRSLEPTSDNFRVFPKLEDIVNNTFGIDEILPNYGRDMDFKLTVRDNNANGGNVDIKLVSFTTDAGSGPFRDETSFLPGTVWHQNDPAIVSWSVANTDQAPVNCTEVDIFLSVDGGFTYPYTLAQNAPNDGSHEVIVPDVLTETARVKIKASNNIFFDISDIDFKITWSTSNQDLADDQFIKTYPNPASNLLNIEMENISTENLSLEVFDMKGALIVSRNIDTSNYQLDLKQFATGMYRIRLRNGNIEWNDKLVVVK